VAILDEDPARRVQGRENFRAWMQEHAERTISELHGTHFDIPQPAHRIEAVIAPTNDGGISYTGPSEDWSPQSGGRDEPRLARHPTPRSSHQWSLLSGCRLS
jgi:uncharacterized protein (DUF885 family)